MYTSSLLLYCFDIVILLYVVNSMICFAFIYKCFLHQIYLIAASSIHLLFKVFILCFSLSWYATRSFLWLFMNDINILHIILNLKTALVKQNMSFSWTLILGRILVLYSNKRKIWIIISVLLPILFCPVTLATVTWTNVTTQKYSIFIEILHFTFNVLYWVKCYFWINSYKDVYKWHLV